MSDPPRPETFLSGKVGFVGPRRSVPLRALDRVLDLELRARRIGPRLDSQAAASPRRRVLVLCVYRPGSARARALPAALRSERHDLTFAFGAIGDAAPELREITVASGLDGGKFENLNEILRAGGHAAGDFDWTIVTDDDIVLPERLTDRLAAAAESLDFALAQPAQTLASHAAWPVTRRRPLSVARQTEFVEIGPLFVMRSDVAAELTPFPDLRFGWGLELHWSALARERGWRLGVVDALPVRHDEAGVANSYRHADAVAEAARFLTDRPYVESGEADRTLAVYRRLPEVTRLLFVCPDMRTGGAERHWATLIPELKARGLDAHVLCLAEEGGLFGDLTAAGVPATCVHMRGRLDPRRLRRALRFAEPRPDAVVSRGVSAQIVAAAIARRARTTHVLNEHTPLTTAGDLLPARRHQRALLRLVAPRVGHVIAVCDQQIEPLVRLGYRRERIEVVPNGIFDGEHVPAAGREATRAALGLAGGEFAALSVSRLEPEKRVDVFIRAIGKARERLPGIRAFVAGEGREMGHLRPLAAAANVEMLGVRRDVPDLMAAADAVCLTSDAEALPMAVLEAMSLGRPVIASDVGGTSQAIGDAGLVVPPGDPSAAADALATLAADPARAGALGAAARERQREHFTGAGMVDGYVRVLGSL